MPFTCITPVSTGVNSISPVPVVLIIKFWLESVLIVIWSDESSIIFLLLIYKDPGPKYKSLHRNVVLPKSYVSSTEGNNDAPSINEIDVHEPDDLNFNALFVVSNHISPLTTV